MVYWSDLDTSQTTDDGLIWGVTNVLEGPNPAYNWVYGICDNLIAGQPVAVGYANDDNYNQHAAIWHGTTLTFLMEPAGLVQDPSDIEGVAYAVSTDGSVVVGSYDYYDPIIGDWRYVPCWWDSDGVVHDLPSASGPDSTYLGEAFGVDGDMIWGYGYTTPRLTLAKIYPSQQPDNQYAFNGWNANFGYEDFSQISLAMWCCKTIMIQGPFQYVLPSFQMVFRPDGASVYFKDINKNMLFSATFTNPGPVNDQYHIMFSVDTMAQTYSMYGNGIEWVSTDAAFPNVGLIYSGMS